ncbi:AAA family ATPase [Halogeometricum sp. CBA1124]|uniref:AAA family ATPase n=1 Tax=Halogeometricum sp. CBA1124 TaxID=2668071 RepID=UPI00142B6780|nr:AAA family ATPase [Halogeometricum sp. CBA1124]MUV56757.1 AAA family ATPase [Halogeometricum sp. CBA1124]
MADDEGLELTVRGAEKRDAGRGIARLPEGARQRLGVLSGDTVVVEGGRETVAKVWPAGGGTPDGVVLIDADTRANADAKIGETVHVRKVDVEDAASVTLSMPDGVAFSDDDRAVELIKRAIQDRPIQSGGQIRFESLSSDPFVVSETSPDGMVRVTSSTRLKLTKEGRVSRVVTSVSGGEDEDAPTGVTYEDIGGLDEELDLVREMIELPLSEPEVFAHLGVDPPKGVLLHGPPGTGKTLIAKAVATEVDATFITISGPEIMSKFKGESEEKLREKFEEARQNAPAIVFFDEIDSIAGKRDDGGDVENRVVGQLLSLMDGLAARGDVIVIGATNRVDSLDPALRRGGRFDREIEIGVPNEVGRREILEVHTRRMPLAEDVDVDRLAARTHGFVGADLESLAKEAAMTALRRARRGGETISFGELEVTREDFEAAMASVEPSAMREYVAEAPTTTFDDVGGLEEAKRTLERSVTWPLTYAPLFEAANTTPPSGVLLHGPPGTGKTMLAKAVANETDATFIKMAGSELVRKFIGEGSRLVRDLFELAADREPAVIFIDEIDAVASKRTDSKTSGDAEVQRTMMQLLSEMDGFDDRGEIRIMAATNRFDMLDEAILRPGRFDRLIEVPNPDSEGIVKILEIHTREMNVADDVDFEDLAEELEGQSGADIASLTTEAGMYAIRDDRTEVRREDFDDAIEKMRDAEESGTIPGHTDYQY